jgi:hypothetical protein
METHGGRHFGPKPPLFRVEFRGSVPRRGLKVNSRLLLTGGDHDAILRHLIAPQPDAEEVAFIFAAIETRGSLHGLLCREWFPVPSGGFLSRGMHHLELTDEARAGAIRKAHQLDAALVELHSHPYSHEASFSWSDVSGLREFVPHVRWRLKGRPYAAIVVAPRSYDSLIWTGGSIVPSGTLDLEIDGMLLRPTGLSLAAWRDDRFRKSP